MIAAVRTVVGSALIPTCQQWRMNSCRTVGRQVRSHSIRHRAVTATDTDSATRRQTSKGKAPIRRTNRRMRVGALCALWDLTAATVMASQSSRQKVSLEFTETFQVVTAAHAKQKILAQAPIGGFGDLDLTRDTGLGHSRGGEHGLAP